jgi:hypothetical protein
VAVVATVIKSIQRFNQEIDSLYTPSYSADIYFHFCLSFKCWLENFFSICSGKQMIFLLRLCALTLAGVVLVQRMMMLNVSASSVAFSRFISPS